MMFLFPRSTVASSLRKLFAARGSRLAVTAARRARSAASGGERLEERLAMAVDFYASPFGGATDWMTVVANNGSDVYVQAVATNSNDLYIADNASFIGRQVVVNGNTALNEVHVYNGVTVSQTVDHVNRIGTPLGYPWLNGNNGQLLFPLPSDTVDTTQPITGSIDLRDGTPNSVIQFTNQGAPAGRVLITNGPGTGTTMTFTLPDQNARANILFTNPTYFSATAGAAGTPELSIRYDTDVVDNIDFIDTRSWAIPVLNGATGQRFQLFDPLMHQYVPGTARGSLAGLFGGDDGFVTWQVDSPDQGIAVPLSFNGRNARAAIFVVSFFTNTGTGAATTVFVSGTLNTFTGVATFRFEVDSSSNGFDANPTGPFGVELPEFTIALRDFDENNSSGDPLALDYDGLGNVATVWPGMTFLPALVADLPNPDSAVSIESPITADRRVQLSASQVIFNAPVRSNVELRVPSGAASAFGTITEEILVNAPVGAPGFDLRVGENPLTDAIDRSRVVISQSGSFSNLVDVLNVPPATLPSAAQVYMEVEDGDVFVEGRIVATSQTWIMQSDQMVADVTSNIGDYPGFEPYKLTTKSRLTGVDTGLIEATTLAITLANDTIIMPPVSGNSFVPSRAFSELDLSTDVVRLRVQAADRGGDPLEVPFPYLLSVREENDLIVDAVAASSMPISIETVGDLTTLGHLQSYGDVSLTSGADFTVLAPISTVFGAIDMVAPTIDVRAAVRVYDTVQDERDVDIRMEATAGAIGIADAISGVNRIILVQAGDGDVAGNGRIFADVLEINADGDVDVNTAATRVAVRTDGSVTVRERDYGVMEIRDARNVTLVAGGYDQVVSDRDLGGTTDRAYTSPALYADVYDASQLTVSAPNGSVDVLVHGTNPITVGDRARLGTSEEVRMEAAGSVVIRTTLGEMLINDAPSATGNATRVAAATVAALNGTYARGSAGVVADRINGVRLSRVNQQITELDRIDATTLRAGDRILVKDGIQDANVGLAANGIYQVNRITYPVGDTTHLFVDLVRTAGSDTTQELAEKHYVRVTGGELLANTVWTADGSTRNVNGVPEYLGWGAVAGLPNLRFSNVFDNDPGVNPVVVAPIMPEAGFVAARMMTTQPLLNDNLRAQYSPIGGTIRGDGPTFRIPDFNGITPRVGDLVLVAQGAGDGSGKVDARSNGLYEVTQLGDGSSIQWELTRYSGVDDDGDGVLDRFYTGRVAVNEGSLRTAATGQMYEVRLMSLGYVPLRYQPVTQYDPSAGVAFDSVLNFQVDIGTNKPAAPVVFNVSTSAGSNDATGSFGRMLTLIQANAAINQRLGTLQDQLLQFDPSVSGIELTQELPDIYRSLSIQAGTPVFIDGTQIETNSIGQVVRSGSVLTRLGPLNPAEVSTARRLYRPSLAAAASTVNGLEFLPSSAGSSVSGLSFGGFNNGAAILVSAENVLVENVTIGLDPRTGTAVANAVGVEFIGAVAHSTVTGSRIQSANVGIRLNTNSEEVHIVGNTIGAFGAGNGIGIQTLSNSIVPSYIGASGISATSVIAASGRVLGVDLGLDQAVIEVPQTASNQYIRPGMFFLDTTNAIAREIVAIGYSTTGGNQDKNWVLTLADASQTAPGGVGALAQGQLLSGQIGHRVESSKGGVISASGRVTAGDTEIVLPASIARGDIYLGMQISSVQPGIGGSNRITSIKTINGLTVLELERPIGESAVSLLLIDQALPNDIGHNSDGVVLDSLASRIVNSVIHDSVYVGLDVRRTDDAAANNGTHVIGDALGVYPGLDGAGNPATITPSSAENVVLYGNGIAGIQLSDNVFQSLGAFSSPPNDPFDYGVIDSFLDARLRIRGNLVGLNGSGEVFGNGASGTENIVIDLGQSDPRLSDLDRIKYLLFDDVTVRNPNGPDPNDDLPMARLRPIVSTGLDSQGNRQGLGSAGTSPETNPEEIGDRRPLVRR